VLNLDEKMLYLHSTDTQKGRNRMKLDLFFYFCHRVLANLTPGALVSLRSLSTRPFGFAMLLASYVLYVCVLLHATLLS
jgi:hypothetical protein